MLGDDVDEAAHQEASHCRWEALETTRRLSLGKLVSFLGVLCKKLRR